MSRPLPDPPALAHVLAAWGREDAAVAPLGRGLIHLTLAVDGGGRPPAVLQRVNPIFPPAIHHDVEFVTRRLATAGLETLRLIPTRDGRLWNEPPGGGVWRLLTRIDGVSHPSVESPRQAEEAGRLVGRFHAALAGAEHVFAGARPGVHDTAGHLARLAAIVAGHRDHRLHAEVAPLTTEIAAAAGVLPPLPPLAPLVGHGDLKFDNVLFEPGVPAAAARALCLVDLDTVGPIHLGHELGDAWRSWCNRGGEDAAAATFDLEVFAAALAGYREGRGRVLSAAERAALLAGPEWISLELAARFAADALAESYFGWDRERYPAAGEHHLARARGQWALHRAVVACRGERADLLGLEAV